VDVAKGVLEVTKVVDWQVVRDVDVVEGEVCLRTW